MLKCGAVVACTAAIKTIIISDEPKLQIKWVNKQNLLCDRFPILKQVTETPLHKLTTDMKPPQIAGPFPTPIRTSSFLTNMIPKEKVAIDEKA